MARTKFRTIRRRKRPKIFIRKSPAEATGSSPAKSPRTDSQLQPVGELSCSSSMTSAAMSASITATGLSISANKPTETTASAKKLSLKKLTVDSNDSSHESDASSYESDDSTSSSCSDTKSTAINSSTEDSHSKDEDDSPGHCEGYRIIDVLSLEQVLRKAAMCCKCQGELKMEESSSARQGLASHLQICCTQCDSRHTVSYPLATSSVKEKELN